MLPPFIIEQIRKREQEQREQRDEQPQLELPPSEDMRRPDPTDDEPNRGVVIVELG
jgi:hypothetical protein